MKWGQGVPLVGAGGRFVGPEDRINAAARALHESRDTDIAGEWEDLQEQNREVCRAYIEALDDAGFIIGRGRA